MKLSSSKLTVILTLFCGFVACCFASFFTIFHPAAKQTAQIKEQRASVVLANHEEPQHDVVDNAKPDVAKLERQARERWARRHPAMARQVARPGSYTEVAHLVQRSDWEALQPTHRRMLRNLILDARAGIRGVMPCFAPGTDLKTVRAFEDTGNALAYFTAGFYWVNTSSGVHNRGKPLTLRWSVVPDGTAIPGAVREPAAPSNFKERFNSIYGNEETWRALLRGMFARYSELSGIRYIEETDDGAAMGGDNNGVAGVRGDVRIGGHHIDGNFGILAYNYFPDVGDMVIDTNDSFFTNLTSDSLGFRNVLAHEHGHGLGFPHVCPMDETKLMEPVVSRKYDGPQIDDIQNTQRGYGDTLEENDTQAGGTDLGTLAAGTISRTNLSLDSNTDQDFFRFSIASSRSLSVTLRPQGGSYLSGPETSTRACSAGTTYNASAQRDLRLAVLDNTGTVVLEVNATGAGSNEALPPTRLTSSSGPFALRVAGDAVDAIQLYSLELTLADVASGADFLLASAPTLDDASGNGNADGRPDPGESSIAINIPLRNVGGLGATNVQSTLVSLTTGVSVVQASFSYPNIAVNSVADSSTRPVIAIASNFVCGTPIQLRLDVQSNQGSKSLSIAFTTGQPGPQSTFTYAGSAVTIPDAGTVDVPLTVSGMSVISDVNVRIGNIAHLYTRDLTVTLISPAGTEVTLFEGIGGSGDNFINTVLDDEASQVIGLAGSAPFTGTFKPNGLLSIFDGENADGTWKLRVEDAESPDVGVVNAFSLQISGVVCGTPGGGKSLPAISINDQSITEGNSGLTTATFTVSLDQPSVLPVSVNYTTASGTTHSATSNDYVDKSSTLSFAPGETTKTLSVSVTGEALNEVDETFVVNLSGAVNATIGDAQGIGTIINDDPLPVLSVENVNLVEGNSGTSILEFTVALSAPSGRDISVDYATADGTAGAGSDYIAKSGTLAFESGATRRSIGIAVQGDSQFELDETFAFNLSNATFAALASNSGIGTILNDDTAGVSITPTSGLTTTEAGGQTAFQIGLSSQPTADITMTFSSSNPAEGVVTPASLIFTPQNWQVPQTAVVIGVDDAAVDGAQQYRIATKVQSADPQYGNREVAEVTIVNQDNDIAALGLSLSSIGVAETVGSLTGTITRNFRVNEALTVALNSSSGRIRVPSTLTIPAGSALATFPIEVPNNTIADGNQTATISAAVDTFAASHTLTITDDETARLTLQLSAPSVAENAATPVVGTITRNTPSNVALVVNLTSSDLTEARVPSTVTIPAGSTLATFAITPIDDIFADGPRLVTIRAVATGFATPATANLTVTDNEKPTLTLTISSERIVENGVATATLRRNDEITSATPALTVLLTANVLSQVTIPRSINIAARAASVSFSVRGVNDTLADGPRIITVAAKASGYIAGAADIIVTDNEAASTGSIGGKVLLPSTIGSLPVPGVQLTLRQGTILMDRVVTASNGTYNFRVLPVGSYTVTPVKASYSFSPLSRAVSLTALNRNPNTIDFGGVPRPQIGGVITSNNLPLANVNVVARSATGSFSVRTNSAGRYLFDRLPLGTYHVVPLRTGTFFNPKFLSLTLTPALPAAVDKNFAVQGTDTVVPANVQVIQPTATSFNQTTQSTLIAEGTASDNTGGSGVTAVTIAVGRFTSTGATVPNGFLNWNNRTFLTTDNALLVESLASGTGLWKLTHASALTSLRTLPPGSYGIRATAFDNAGNLKRSVWKRFAVTSTTHSLNASETSTTRINGSGIGLSYALAQANQNRIVLRFTGALSAESAGDVNRYVVQVRGEVIEIESVSYQAATATVTIGLPEGNMQMGDSVVVKWQNLSAAQGFTLSDKTINLQAH